MTATETARILTIDQPSVTWAHALGVRQRLETEGLDGIRGSKYCPFREGTPHRKHWIAGWQDRSAVLQLRVTRLHQAP